MFIGGISPITTESKSSYLNHHKFPSVVLVPNFVLRTEDKNYIILETKLSNVSLDSLRSYFANYGDVQDPVILRDKETSKEPFNDNSYIDISRGFGFITFRDPQMLDLVLSMTPHIVDGKQVRFKFMVKCNEG